MSSALSEHEYEPIGSPSILAAMSTMSTMNTPSTAPVVRINDTDVINVADSDESLDVQERIYSPKQQLVLDGDIIVPLDGEIEDRAMQARELGETGDTSEDQETAQQLQDRLEERFLNAATPCTESRTDAEINTSQVDSSALEELPLRRGARGLPQRLRSQAGKLRSRLRGIQRPSFSLPERQKTDKTKTTKVEKPKSVKSGKTEKSRFSLPDRPKFSLPERPKFNFPDRAKFSMPERPKFNMPERPKFNIKRPNINLPTLGRTRKPLKERQNSAESTSGSKRNIFDFSTYPRIFNKSSKNRGDYATSSPKTSRGQSPEIATVPRAKKKTPIGAKWVQRFSDIKYADDEPDSAVERSKPWRHPSIEDPQVSFPKETTESPERLPWEESDERSIEESRERRRLESQDDLPIERIGEHGDEEIEYNEEDSVDIENRRIMVALPVSQVFADDLEDEEIVDDVHDPRLYPRGLERDSFEDHKEAVKAVKKKWLEESNDIEVLPDREEDHEDEMEHHDSYGNEEYVEEIDREEDYGGNFMPIDPPRKLYIEREQTPDETSVRSDREQQSSGSSSDRRRRGVLEEIDSDEFFLRAKGISQDDMNMGRFLASEIRDAFRPTGNALADHELDISPPMRPVRTRSLRKRRDENTPESYDATPPARPKRDRRKSEESLRAEEYQNYLPDKTSGLSGSRHRVIYQAEGIPKAIEPLDDIVVVKPARRKSRSVARSVSESESGFQPIPMPPTPPVAPRRRKRGRRDAANLDKKFVNGHRLNTTTYNGHSQEMDWQDENRFPTEENHDNPEVLSEEQLETFMNRLDHEYIEPTPIAPKRRSRSRGTSVADDDRTSRGAESLPEVSYLEEEDSEVQHEGDRDSHDLPGYAVVDKREKPPRPPPPRRRRDKFATCPKTSKASTNPVIPVRPQRAYSTLGPARRRSTSEDRSVNQLDVTPYTEVDSDDPDVRDLRSGQVLNKIQGRPLPAPPRPPRSRRDVPEQDSVASNSLVEVAASTQTDPLPDDVVIEEEITRAKMVMSPSRSGSQILVSTERIASPTFGRNSPAVPPLPQLSDRERTRDSISPGLVGFNEPDEVEERNVETKISESRELVLDERTATPVTPTTSISLQHEDRIRIASLEVADLRVERLNVNHIEAQKISASEVDAVVVSASELSGNSNITEIEIHPSLLRELIAIRSQLELVAANQQGRESTPEKKTRTETSTVVEELIEALKKSDNEENDTQDFMEESETVEQQAETNVEAEQIKLVEEKQPVPEIQEPEKKDEEMIQEVQVCEETLVVINTAEPEAKIEKIEESKSLEIFPESSDPVMELTSDESLQEITEIHISQNDSIPTKKECKDQCQPSNKEESQDDRIKSSRSRSLSPTKDGKKLARQTASPVKSLPPLISVTPDTPDPVPSPVPEVQVQPQRATVSYANDNEEELSQRQPHAGVTQYVAFPTSQIPANFFSLASSVESRLESEPSIVDTTQQLLRALRLAGTRAMRHFVGYVASRVSTEDQGEKIKEVELALCALLLLVAGLLILCFGTPHTVTHYHHWDYFNPPQ